MIVVLRMRLIHRGFGARADRGLPIPRPDTISGLLEAY